MDETLVRAESLLVAAGGVLALFGSAVVARAGFETLLSFVAGALLLAGAAVTAVAWWRDASARTADRGDA